MTTNKSPRTFTSTLGALILGMSLLWTGCRERPDPVKKVRSGLDSSIAELYKTLDSNRILTGFVLRKLHHRHIADSFKAEYYLHGRERDRKSANYWIDESNKIADSVNAYTK